MDTDSMFGYGRGGGGSDSGRGSISGSLFTKEEREEKLRKTMIEGVWKGILEPALEYSQVSSFDLSIVWFDDEI